MYVLTSRSPASASERVINYLKPYINVIQIGAKTICKNVGSVKLYDLINFRKQNTNPNHTYAKQLIVIKTVNKNGFCDYAQSNPPYNPTN